MTEYTEETKIRGLQIKISDKNLKIIDSYQINNVEKMKLILSEVLNKTFEYRTKRTMNSLIHEWKSHNRLYKLHLFKKHTKDCDLAVKTNIIIEIIYFILGI